MALWIKIATRGMQQREVCEYSGASKPTRGRHLLPAPCFEPNLEFEMNLSLSSCRLVHESSIATLIADELATVESHTLAEALLDVLLQFSYHQETAHQIVQSTAIFSSQMRILREFKCKLNSVLLPSLLDLLWNLLETMPKPRTLPRKVNSFLLIDVLSPSYPVGSNERL